ncbi:MOSC domain-containing protein [Primorskyibacter sp. S87]|uniref:MOSC domain-containing protein n=1 Tax=Primorskyibacter sp. S87 TaxID=3415126 RepID=UPI003C7E78B1
MTISCWRADGIQASREDLDRALPGIMAAPKDGAAIGMLCLRPGNGERRFVGSIEVTHDRGIPGERWNTRPWLTLPDGAPDPRIQICILQERVLEAIWLDRENTVHPGDTFIVDMDLSEPNLKAGQLLQAGSAVLQVSDLFNDACVKWKVRYGAAARDWVNASENRHLRLRGILCSVQRDGIIRNGDRLTKVDPATL